MVDGLDRLGHHAVVCCNHDDGDVRDLRAARTHRGKGGVARGVDEGHRLSVVLDLVGADVLGDAPGLAGDDVRLPDRVEEARLTVVDVAEDGDDRRPRLEVLVLVLEQGPR